MNPLVLFVIAFFSIGAVLLTHTYFNPSEKDPNQIDIQAYTKAQKDILDIIDNVGKDEKKQY